MKVAVVPAQVTTIEDKVAGSLSLTQLILLVIPVFGCGLLYGIGPPVFTAAPYKLVLGALLCLGFGGLAIRLRGRLVVEWLVIITRYLRRPLYYVADKNYAAHRRRLPGASSMAAAVPVSELPLPHRVPPPPLLPHEQVAIESRIARASAQLHFVTDKKGNLRVAISKTD